MLTFGTLSGLYSYSRRVSSTLLCADNADSLRRRLKEIAADDAALLQLQLDLENLRDHIRSFAMSDVMVDKKDV